mgnify:CR=1 FL=1
MNKGLILAVGAAGILALGACSSDNSSGSASASASTTESAGAAACASIQTAFDNKGQNAAELKTELDSIKASAPPAIQAAITTAVLNLQTTASAGAASASAAAASAASEVSGVLVPACKLVGVDLNVPAAASPTAS